MSYPATDVYDDVVCEEIVVRQGGDDVTALLCRPTSPGPHPALVIGQEATGLNIWVRRVAATLAHGGIVTLVPDYFRGDGPADPESLDDIDGIMAHVGRLDFLAGTRLMLSGMDLLAARPDVDADRIGVWGYCTGATMSLLAACARHEVAVSVLFYPSQPTFEGLDDAHPAHPIDLLWLLEGPSLFVYGEADIVMPPPQLAELGRRLEAWCPDAVLQTYEGAGHAFNTQWPGFFHAHAAEHSWNLAVDFVHRKLFA